MFFASPLARNPKWRWWASGRHRKQPQDETLTNNNSKHTTHFVDTCDTRGWGLTSQQWLRRSLLTKSHKGNRMRRIDQAATPTRPIRPEKASETYRHSLHNQPHLSWAWLLTRWWHVFYFVVIVDFSEKGGLSRCFPLFRWLKPTCFPLHGMKVEKNIWPFSMIPNDTMILRIPMIPKIKNKGIIEIRGIIENRQNRLVSYDSMIPVILWYRNFPFFRS